MLRGNVNGHALVELNFFAPSTTTNVGEWDPLTDGAVIMKNALLFSIAGAVRGNPGSIAFPDTAVGATASSTVTLENGSNVAFRIEPPDPTPTIAPGESESFGVRFVPAAAINAAATLTITPVDPSLAPVDVALKGAAISMLLGAAPASIDFGLSTVGRASKPIPITLTNNGTSAITLAEAAVSPSLFSLDTTGPLVIPGKGSLTVSAIFTPADTMPAEGKIDFALAAAPNRAIGSVALRGEGIPMRMTGGGGTGGAGGFLGGCSTSGTPDRSLLALAPLAVLALLRSRRRRRD